jgi:hypothetical protein
MAMRDKKGVMLIELTITLILSGVILLAASQFMIFHTQFSNILQKEVSLQQEAVSIMNHINAKVRSSTKVVTGVDKLDIYGSTGAKTGTYSWSGNELLYNSELVSNRLNTITFSDPSGQGQTSLMVVTADVTIGDAQTGTKKFISTISCRLSPLPVRLVVMDLSGNVTQVKNSYATIASAITAASDGDTIQVSNGTYKENIAVSAKSISLLGAYNCKKWIRHLGAPAYKTVIDGQQLDSVIKCNIKGSGKKVTIDGFTITNGKCATITTMYGGGGIYAISTSSGSITISNNIITNNAVNDVSSYGGGGVYAISNTSGSITISNNTITSNAANINIYYNGGGGGVYAISNTAGSITISNNTITNNTTLEDSGGGILASSTDSGSAIIISNNTMTNNTSHTGGGGIDALLQGASALPPASITISSNIITNNTTGTSHLGGGIAASSQNSRSTFIISKNIIIKNTSGIGGGMYAYANYGAFGANTITISNNTITNNTAASRGGGIRAQVISGAAITISNNTITSNTAVSGGGIYASGGMSGVISVLNSIIYQNTASTAPSLITSNDSDPIKWPWTFSISYSDVEGGYSGRGAGTGIINLAPVFVNISDPDPTKNNYHLQDVAGNNWIIDGGNSIITDNDVQPPGLRALRNDMGAYGGPGANAGTEGVQ